MTRADVSIPRAPVGGDSRVSIHTPSTAVWPLLFGAAGGSLGGAIGLGVLAVAASLDGRQPWAAPNAVGAWFVRWLQSAAPPAMDSFYWDASLGGILLAAGVGALAGAVFAGVVEGLPDDHPVAWGLITGAAAWAATRWLVAPALDPALIEAFDSRALLAAHLAAGLFIGLWVLEGRTLARRLPPAAPAAMPAGDHETTAA